MGALAIPLMVGASVVGAGSSVYAAARKPPKPPQVPDMGALLTESDSIDARARKERQDAARRRARASQRAAAASLRPRAGILTPPGGMGAAPTEAKRLLGE